jgi:hypothetical protein
MRIGVTGHQRLDDSSAWSWVTATIDRELDVVEPPLVAITSLAIGADQLLARLVLKRGGAIEAVLPYENLERSFAEADLPSFRELRDQATLEMLQTRGDDEDAYLAAGKRVVDRSDLLIAVWNGKPAKGKGGTGDIVQYALEHGVPTVHINPTDRSLKRYEKARNAEQ